MYDQRIRVVAADTGTFYGQAMTAGRHLHHRRRRDLRLLGGGGSATSAELYFPKRAVDGSGNVLVADRNNNRVRVVAGNTGTFYGPP